MSDGELGNPERIAKRLQTVGKEPLGNFRVCQGPSNRSAAMMTYFYDRKAGIAYHNRVLKLLRGRQDVDRQKDATSVTPG